MIIDVRFEVFVIYQARERVREGEEIKERKGTLTGNPRRGSP